MEIIQECSICWSLLENNIITLPCNHIFHNNCFELWKIHNNTCPYCRYYLEDTIIPQVLFDELIAPDGNIDKLTEENYYKFYKLNENIFPHYYVLSNIDKIKNAKNLKSSLMIGHQYKITGININNHKIGILTHINQISYNGTFSCWLVNDKERFVFISNLHNIVLHS